MLRFFPLYLYMPRVRVGVFFCGGVGEEEWDQGHLSHSLHLCQQGRLTDKLKSVQTQQQAVAQNDQDADTTSNPVNTVDGSR